VLRRLQAIYERTRDDASPVFVAEFASPLSLSGQEAQGRGATLRQRPDLKPSIPSIFPSGGTSPYSDIDYELGGIAGRLEPLLMRSPIP
jgi:hypothetical protein